MVYLQDPRIILGLLGICVLAILIAIVKKAVKVVGVLLLCSVFIAAVRPATTQLMIDNGVSIDGTVLTIQTESEKHVVDLAMGASVSAEEQENGDYIITLNIPQQETQTFTVSKATAAWAKFGVAVIAEFGKVGEQLVENHFQLRY